MKRSLLLFGLFLVAFFERSFGQSFSVDSVTNANFYRNSVYVELLGNGRIGSVNYERLFRLNGDPTMALRLGGLVLPDQDYGYLMLVPAEVSFINGERDVKFEFGFGLTYARFFERERPYDGVVIEPLNAWFPVFKLGARYQPSDKPYFIRLAFTPHYVGEEVDGPTPFLPWAGLSFGYSFGK